MEENELNLSRKVRLKREKTTIDRGLMDEERVARLSTTKTRSRYRDITSSVADLNYEMLKQGVAFLSTTLILR